MANEFSHVRLTCKFLEQVEHFGSGGVLQELEHAQADEPPWIAGHDARHEVWLFLMPRRSSC